MDSLQDLRLTWVNYNQKLTESLNKFLRCEALCNVTLTANRRSIKAHQAILSACSPWFEEVLLENKHPHPIIIIKDVRYEDLKNIIKFIYTGEVSVPQHDIQDFLRTAELLEIKGLLRGTAVNQSLLLDQPVEAAPVVGQHQHFGSAQQPQQQHQQPVSHSPSLNNNHFAHASSTGLPQLPTVPVSSVLLAQSNAANPITDGGIDLVSQIKVPVSLASVHGSTSPEVPFESGVLLHQTHQQQESQQQPQPKSQNKRRRQGSHGASSKRKIVVNDFMANDPTCPIGSSSSVNHHTIIVQQPSSSVVSTSACSEHMLVQQQEQHDHHSQHSHHNPVHHGNGHEADPHDHHHPHHHHPGIDDEVAWPTIEEEVSAATEPESEKQQTTSLTPAQIVSNGVSDCGAFKRMWAERYLCYNLGREIICLLCFCRFTQFKKFNLERHMKNKHPQLFNLPESTRKLILERYVSRYEGMVASVPSNGNETMATEIMAVGPIQLADLSDLDLDIEQGPGGAILGRPVTSGTLRQVSGGMVEQDLSKKNDINLEDDTKNDLGMHKDDTKNGPGDQHASDSGPLSNSDQSGHHTELMEECRLDERSHADGSDLEAVMVKEEKSFAI